MSIVSLVRSGEYDGVCARVASAGAALQAGLLTRAGETQASGLNISRYGGTY